MQHCMCSSEVSQQMCLTFEVGKKLESNVLFFKLNNSLVWFGFFFLIFFSWKKMSGMSKWWLGGWRAMIVLSVCGLFSSTRFWAPHEGQVHHRGSTQEMLLPKFPWSLCYWSSMSPKEKMTPSSPIFTMKWALICSISKTESRRKYGCWLKIVRMQPKLHQRHLVET